MSRGRRAGERRSDQVGGPQLTAPSCW